MRKWILSATVALFLVSCLFPPVIKKHGRPERPNRPERPMRPEQPERPKRAERPGASTYYVTREFIGKGSPIDVRRLLIQWAVLSLASGSALYFVSKRQRAKQKETAEA